MNLHHHRSFFARTAMSVGAAGLLLAPLAPAASAKAPYCATVQKAMQSMSSDSKTPADAAKQMKAMAKALRSSKPPADLKATIGDYASSLEKLADKLKGGDQKAFLAFIKNPKFLASNQAFVSYFAKNCVK